MIELRAIDRSSWRTAAGLRLAPEQAGLVSPNVYSIAEAAFEPHYRPRLVLASGVPVGFLMYCVETDPPDPELFWLFRLMIAADHQGKGCGREALRLALLEMQAAFRVLARGHCRGTIGPPTGIVCSRPATRGGCRWSRLIVLRW